MHLGCDYNFVVINEFFLPTNNLPSFRVDKKIAYPNAAPKFEISGTEFWNRGA